MMPDSKPHATGRIRARTQTAEGLLFILPYAILWLLFLFGPILYGFYISLHKWDPLAGSTFVGFKNYLGLFGDARFWNSFWVTWKYSLWVIPGIIIFGLVFALMLQAGRFPGSAVFEAVLFFPYLLNVSIISILWKLMLDPDVGVISQALRSLGVTELALLNDESWVIPMVALTTVWWLMGYRMILFRAALASIPDEFYEAAAIDGATPLRRFISITLPLLKPTLLFVFVVTTVGGMRTFGQIILMTAGGPGTSSEVLAYYMYKLGFEFLQFGKAAAVGFILFAMIFGVSALLFFVFRLESHLK